MNEHEFGVFNELFDEGNYLKLLNLRSTDDVKENVNLISKVITFNPIETVLNDLGKLIGSDNWRPQLFGCFSIFIVSMSSRESLIKDLRKRILKGSWITPQLLVTLYKIDDEFDSFTTEIITQKHIGNSKISGAIKFLSNEPEPNSSLGVSIAEMTNNYSKYRDMDEERAGFRIARKWKNNLEDLIEQEII